MGEDFLTKGEQMPVYTPEREAALRLVIDWYKNPGPVGFKERSEFLKAMGVEESKAIELLCWLRDNKAIDVKHEMGGWPWSFVPVSHAETLLEKAIEMRQSRADFVESIGRWARQNKLVASAIVILATLAAVASLANNIIDIIQKLKGK